MPVLKGFVESGFDLLLPIFTRVSEYHWLFVCFGFSDVIPVAFQLVGVNFSFLVEPLDEASWTVGMAALLNILLE